MGAPTHPVPVRAPGPHTVLLCLSAALEAVHPGVSPGAEAGPPLDPALALPSPPSPALDLAPAPGAAPAPTQDPGASRGGVFLCLSLSAAIVCAGHPSKMSGFHLELSYYKCFQAQTRSPN